MDNTARQLYKDFVCKEVPEIEESKRSIPVVVDFNKDISLVSRRSNLIEIDLKELEYKADKRLPESCFRLGIAFLGKLNPWSESTLFVGPVRPVQNLKKAISQLLIAANLGHTDAQYTLWYLKRLVGKDVVTGHSVKWLVQAAAFQHPLAQRDLKEALDNKEVELSEVKTLWNWQPQ